eukprot:scaffold11454_cov168-Amphora_coffeaeformis.AAC.20
MVTRTLVQHLKISSFGFSGAGFLASYHLGVVKCLQERGLLTSEKSLVPLTGVSAGALVAASIAAGMDADDGMETVLEIARKARQAGRLMALQPGFSLVDVMEAEVRERLHKAVGSDNEEFLRRIDHGRNLRIGLTDRRVWPPVGPNPRAMCYVDQYRDIDDVVAACVLSSYIPGVTGPALGSKHVRHHAILRAAQRLQEMLQHGCVKQGLTGEPLRPSDVSSDLRELYWDGGLVNAFPIFDANTVIITPIAADFVNKSINPSIEYRKRSFPLRKWQANPTTKVHMTAANAHTFRSLVLNPDENNLQFFFAKGYDNGLAFLDQQGLVEVFNSTCQQPSTT